MGQSVIRIIGASECPYCYIPLRLKRNEVIEIELDRNGNPINNEVTDFDIEMICPKCNKHFDYYFNKSNMSFVAYSKLRQKLDIYNMSIDNKSKAKSPFVRGELYE